MQHAPAETPAAEYLSDSLSDRIISVIQGWGDLGFNTAVRALHQKPMSLRIKDKQYRHGLGHHANGEIVVELGGQFRTFQTDVGIQWQGGQNVASVIFRVYVDDKKVFDSGIVRESDPPRPVTVPVEGGEELRLVADDAGNGITCDCANWADARLIRNPAATERPLAAAVDIVPFGQVVTWDPAVKKGTAAGRVEEFPAADLRPARELLPAADGTYRVPMWGTPAASACSGTRTGCFDNWCFSLPTPQRRCAIRSSSSIGSGNRPGKGVGNRSMRARTRSTDSLVWSLRSKGLSRGTQKVRWIFPGAGQAMRSASRPTRGRGGRRPVSTSSLRPAILRKKWRSICTTA